MGRCHCASRRKVRLIINISLASVKSFPPQIRESPCVSAIMVFLDSCFLVFLFVVPVSPLFLVQQNSFVYSFFFDYRLISSNFFCHCTVTLFSLHFFYSLLFFFLSPSKNEKGLFAIGTHSVSFHQLSSFIPVNFPCSSLPPPPFSLFSLRGFLPDALFLARFPRVQRTLLATLFLPILSLPLFFICKAVPPIFTLFNLPSIPTFRFMIFLFVPLLLLRLALYL